MEARYILFGDQDQVHTFFEARYTLFQRPDTHFFSDQIHTFFEAIYTLFQRPGTHFFWRPGPVTHFLDARYWYTLFGGQVHTFSETWYTLFWEARNTLCCWPGHTFLEARHTLFCWPGTHCFEEWVHIFWRLSSHF